MMTSCTCEEVVCELSCVSCVMASCMCDDGRSKWGVREAAGGGGGGEGGGIQNQKQEPHTKMWGKNVEPNFAQAAAHLPVKK